MSKGFVVGLTVILVAVLVAASQLGLATISPEGQIALTGGAGALILVARMILKKISTAGWGWKAITAGLALLVVAGSEVVGIKLPLFIANVLAAWGSFGLGDAVGLLKPVPKG
jgi:hypothetical protein